MPNPIIARRLLWSSKKLAMSRILSTQPVAYLPLDDAGGDTARDISGFGRSGNYNETGADDISLWTPRDMDAGLSVPFFDSSDARYIDMIGSGQLANACDWDEFSFAICARVSDVSIWTDGVNRYLLNFAAGEDGLNNYFHVLKKSNNVLEVKYCSDLHNLYSSTYITDTKWFQVLVTISLSAGQMVAYLNNMQISATRTISSAWSEPDLTFAALGANLSGSLQWSGYLAHFCLWNKILTQAERNKVFILPDYTPVYPDMIIRAGNCRILASVEDIG